MLQRTSRKTRILAKYFSSSKTISYYEILEIDNTATTKEVKSSYLTKAKLMHPDTMEAPTEDDNIQFQKLNEAYKTLKDPVLRKMYDMNLKNGIHGPPEHNPNFSNMENSRKFYENRWYNGNIPKDDLRYNDDFNKEFNDFLKGGPSEIPFLRRFVSEETYERITSFRYKFITMLFLIILFEWTYMKAKKKEDKRLELLHELEEKKNPEYSILIEEYIEGRATNNNFLIE